MNEYAMNEVMVTAFVEWRWHYLLVCAVIGCYDIVILCLLDAPKTLFGRIARTLTWMAHVPILLAMLYCFILASVGVMPHDMRFAAFGMASFPLLLLSFAMVSTQILMDCLKRRKNQPTDAMEHLAEFVAPATTKEKVVRLFVENRR